MSGSTEKLSNTEKSMNTVFITEFDHQDFVSQQQQYSGSPDVVSLREGLGTSDGPLNFPPSLIKDKKRN